MTQFEKTFHVMKNPWTIAFYLIFIILAYLFLDKPIATFFYSLDFRTNVHGLNILTAFGKWKIYIVLFVLLGLYFHYVTDNAAYAKRSWFLLGCVFIPNVINSVLKVSLSRARPELLFSNELYGFYWFKFKDLYWSFPSGHSVTIIGLAAGLGVVFPKYFYAILGLASLVVLSRIFLYYHYLSDVMSGFYLSIVVVALFAHYLEKRSITIK